MKKKILLATAVAIACGAPLAAMADANIYGQFRYSLNSMDADTETNITDQDGLSGNDNVSLFGLKAEAKDDSVTAFAHLQTGANADAAGGTAFAQRFYFGGLKGDFGTVAYGRMTNAYKMPGFKLDPFYNMSHVGAGGTLATGGATYGLSPATNGFTDNALQYTSPSMSGLQINVGTYVDDGNNDDHGTNVGVKYSAKNYHVGVQFASNDKTATVPGVGADMDAMRVDGGYKADNWSAGFSFETVDVDPNNDSSDVNFMYLVGKYNVTKETELVLSMGTVSDDTSNNGTTVYSAKGTGYTLGAFQTVAPKTQVYVSYSTTSLDNAADLNTFVAADTYGDPSVFSVGAIHKF